MKNIGKVIRFYREELSMTREELSRDICSEKYIYLIEKGERTPSTLVLDQILTRLNVPLQKYMLFLNHDDPITVMKLIDEGEEALINHDFKRLETIYLDAINHNESDVFPFNIYLDMSWAMINSLGKKNFLETKSFLEEKFSSIIDFHHLAHIDTLSAPYIRVLNLYAIICAELEDFDLALNIFMRIREHVEKHSNIYGFKDLYIIISLNLVKFYHEKENYDELIILGEEIHKKMIKISFTKRLPYLLSLLAHAYAKVGSYDCVDEYLTVAKHLAKYSENEYLIQFVENIKNRL